MITNSNYHRHVDTGTPYESCTAANLFGKAYKLPTAVNSIVRERGIHWRTFRDMHHSLKRLHMKIRPEDYKSQGERVCPILSKPALKTLISSHCQRHRGQHQLQRQRNQRRLARQRQRAARRRELQVIVQLEGRHAFLVAQSHRGDTEGMLVQVLGQRPSH